MGKLKIGLICVGQEGERLDLAARFRTEAQAALEMVGIEIVNCDDEYTITRQEVMEQTSFAKEKDACAVIYLIGTWILANHVTDAALETNLPIAVWGISEAASFSSVGANVVHGTFEEIGIRHRLFHGMPSDKEVIERIRVFLTAAHAVKELKYARLGLMGGRCINAYPTSADINQVKQIFGVEVEHIDQMLLLERAENADERKIVEICDYFKETCQIEVTDEELKKAAGAAAALEEIWMEYDLKLCSVKCLGEFINSYTCCCLAVAWMNHRGFVCACQCNINAILSMFIMKQMGGEDVYFGDVNTVSKNGVVSLINCGSIPISMAGKERPRLVRQYEYMGKGRGVCTLFCCREGRITFATLGRRKGAYHMNLAVGTVMERPISELLRVRKWAQGFVELDGNGDVFYENILSNHSTACYGELTEEIKEFCALKGIVVDMS